VIVGRAGAKGVADLVEAWYEGVGRNRGEEGRPPSYLLMRV
jgi:hypothetical protein